MVIPELKQIEQKLIAGRYRKHLITAMIGACNQLTTDERLVLLLRYETNLSHRKIAKALGTNGSSAMRQLRAAQRKLRDLIIRALSNQPDMNGRTIAECLRDVIDNPYCEVSLLDCIKESMARRKPPASERQWVKRPALILVKGAERKSNGPLVSFGAKHLEMKARHCQIDGPRLVGQQKGFYDDGKKEF
jgi:hypothetical protein